MQLQVLQALGHYPAKWVPSQRITSGNIPSLQKDWLLDDSSLTQRLIKKAKGDFSVRPLQEYWRKTELNEANRLQCRQNCRVWSREVALLGINNIPWVYAKSIIPCTTATGQERQLLNLNKRALGSYLFSHRHMQRGPIFVASIRPTENQQSIVWARQSLFFLSTKPLLVAEYFLPELFR